VYGVISLPLHRSLTFEQAFIAFVVVTALLFGLVKLKDRAKQRSTVAAEPSKPAPHLSPSLLRTSETTAIE
jgi:hypothetical protein